MIGQSRIFGQNWPVQIGANRVTTDGALLSALGIVAKTLAHNTERGLIWLQNGLARVIFETNELTEPTVHHNIADHAHISPDGTGPKHINARDLSAIQCSKATTK